MARRLPALGTAVVLVLCLSRCYVTTIGFACNTEFTCPSGSFCDQSGHCAAGSAADGGVRDSGAPDGGPRDAGIRDAGPADSGSLDAGASDAGSSDSGLIQVTTLAGNGDAGHTDGTGGPNGSAEFNAPAGVAVDSNGYVYVADVSNNCIRKIDLTGNVTTLAGNGTPGFSDGTGGSNGTAEFNNPVGIAVDTAGTIYVADTGNNRIRMVDTAGNVTTCAGNGAGAPDGGAEFFNPKGLAVTMDGHVYVADSSNNRIRVIDPLGNTKTFAGNGTPGNRDGTGGATGTAEFNYPIDAAVDSDGNVYVADQNNNAIRKITPAGNVSTLSELSDAGMIFPNGVAIDLRGNIYVAASGTNKILELDGSGNLLTLAGNGSAGFLDGVGGQFDTAEFRYPVRAVPDGLGNIYVGDLLNNRVRKIGP